MGKQKKSSKTREISQFYTEEPSCNTSKRKVNPNWTGGGPNPAGGSNDDSLGEYHLFETLII